jgi:hypothetical protein
MTMDDYNGVNRQVHSGINDEAIVMIGITRQDEMGAPDGRYLGGGNLIVCQSGRLRSVHYIFLSERKIFLKIVQI